MAFWPECRECRTTLPLVSYEWSNPGNFKTQPSLETIGEFVSPASRPTLVNLHGNIHRMVRAATQVVAKVDGAGRTGNKIFSLVNFQNLITNLYNQRSYRRNCPVIVGSFIAVDAIVRCRDAHFLTFFNRDAAVFPSAWHRSS